VKEELIEMLKNEIKEKLDKKQIDYIVKSKRIFSDLNLFEHIYSLIT